MDIAVLGPLEVRDDGGHPVAVPPGLPTRLLAFLVLHGGRPASSGELVAALWSEPPATAVNLVHGYVRRLRRALGADRIESTGLGYRLVLRDAELDVDRFRADLAAGRLRAALAHWRGSALPEVADLPWAADAAASLERTRLDALERVLEQDAATGDAGVVGELEDLVAQSPFRERLWAALVRALYAGGRQRDALATYHRARTLLVEELGVEPGPELRDAERAVLEQRAPAGGPPAAAGSVPAPVQRIVGRDDDLAALVASLAGHRVVTLVGPGGVGKTTLALAVASGRSEPCWFVDLAPLVAGDDIAAAVARVVGVRGAGGAIDQVAAYLAERSGLLVLDNCEHVLDAAASLALRLLAACSGLRVLATSREPLAVPGEAVRPLAGLDGPAAADLLSELAAAAGAELHPDARAALDEVCSAVDGLPLALELAAAGLSDMTVAELLVSIREGGAALPERRGSDRHRTLASVVGWSLALLDPQDREGLAALASFAGPFEADSADSVAGSPGIARRLVRRSLLRRDADAGGRARFRLLETVRAQQPDLGRAVIDRYVAHHLAFAEQAAAGLRTGESPDWMRRVRTSSADLRRAVALAFDSDPPSAGRLVAALYWPWFLDGSLEELHGWCERALQRPVDDPVLAARLWWATSATRIARGELDGSEDAARHQVELAETTGEVELEALGRSLLGMVAWARGDLPTSRRHHEGAVQAARAADRWVAALVTVLAARSAVDTDGSAIGAAERVALAAGEPMVIASCRDYAGSAAIGRGDHAAAADLAARALAGYEAVGYQEGIASAHALAGAASAVAGEWATAERHFAEALDVCRRLGHRGGVATAWDGLGVVAAHTDRCDEARAYLARADAERAAIGAAVPPVLAELRDDALAKLRS